jgi:uncharacterized protein
MAISEKPVPETSTWTEPFWKAARERKLIIQRCIDCRKNIFYPRLICPFCFSKNIEWIEASGKGTVYTFTVVENNAPSAFLNDMPYIIAVVRLDEGVQMLSNIVDCEPDQVRCDMPVAVTYKKINEEYTLPVFKPQSIR